MAKTITLGFDIGASELKIVQWNGLMVTKAYHAPMPENLVKNGTIISYEAMGDLIKETMKKTRFSGKQCGVILPSGSTYLRRVTMPAMTVDQLAINLPFEFRDFLDAGKDKFVYDYSLVELVKDESGKPVQMELVAAATAKSNIESYREMFARAGLKLKTAIPMECAYANLIEKLNGDSAAEYAILNLGYTAARIDIYTGSCFEVSHIGDIGIGDLDKAIADGMNVDAHVARTYRENNFQDVLNSELCRDVYHSIATDVRKAVNFYGFNNRDSNLTDIWFCGGGAFVNPLVDIIGEATGLKMHNVAELLPLFHSSEEEAVLYAAATGAAIQ